MIKFAGHELIDIGPIPTGDDLSCKILFIASTHLWKVPIGPHTADFPVGDWKTAIQLVIAWEIGDHPQQPPRIPVP